MKITKSLAILLFLVCGIACAQKREITQKQKDRLKVVQPIFTDKEDDRMFQFYEAKMDEMGLKDTARDNYYHTLYYHLYKIKRLGDKDSGLNNNQQKAAFEKHLAQMNEDMASMLSDDQYKIHLETWSHLKNSVYKKKGWE